MSAPQIAQHHGPRLLTGRHIPLDEHARANGPFPVVPNLIEVVTQSGLRGRGGAWFPTGRKLATVAENGRAAGGAHVIVNGAESEPCAGKDKLLLRSVPHLVLDGAELAALAVGARKVTVCVHRGAGLADGLRTLIAERAARSWGSGLPVEVMEPPRWYVSSESTALAHFVDGGPGKPRSVSTYVSGVDGKPTLVSNTESLAHLALIARRGPSWFRAAGTAEAPGTALYSVSGSVRATGVYELPVGATGWDILDAAGGRTAPLRAVLLGGYGGTWISPDVLAHPFTPEALKRVDASPGAGVVVALPQGACGLVETVRVASWLASQNARQCGPCFNGLPAIADDLARLTWAQDQTAHDRLRFRLGVVNKRGACGHPDGVVKLAATALRVFAEDVRAHLAGIGCPGWHRPSLLPLPTPPSPNEGWR
ncbi:putative Fe-S, FMN containing oxidoreductase [Alloactinosynnema sp. L-07]|uniref:NADH-ubiquinone oxidoreductase-F iron-sulfur binding region domain-containing protein n=1 Tax=Alloactinosynnema sp. L-07 TaxID=1653480 RepID=UPI00065F01FF|nr:NADH-ubiquinone oxidoreductase-F iron-sulfur binding region domain-containing protein [Alloactinosynnema sp. L-07]CRK60738.1 putative Fe-S, FMN containing oxidoreductase [Alloactinosynnema sp. L-07]